VSRTLKLFEGYGIELEYMLVDRRTLQVKPVADDVLREANGDAGGAYVNEVALGQTAWSNELVMHVLEMKTNGPAPSLEPLPELFQADLKRLNVMLAKKNAMVLPTAMHPFFDPDKETRLWPHDSAEIYDAYNRLFDCRGHGWSNLQSIHINLPFSGDEEFGRLHAAIRLALPILPALAASSPIFGGKASGTMDSRLEFYRHNQRRIPELTGGVIPEQAFTEAAYKEKVYGPINRAIRPLDPDGILEDVWLNSRGAIARFDRDAIEIRVLDIQESPRMDGAVIAAVVAAVMGQVREAFEPLAKQQAWAPEPLRPLFVQCVQGGSDAVIADDAFLRAWGWTKGAPLTGAQLWAHIMERLVGKAGYPLAKFARDVAAITDRGCLAKRILRAVATSEGGKASASEADRIHAVYTRLAAVLESGGMFDGTP
jgi:gamma-glutamyl:cysteine ligase YbdK (ATP-grasp superfamily)